MEGLADLISDESWRACFLSVTFLLCCYKMKGMREVPGFSVYVWVPISSVASDSFVTSWTVAHQASPSMEFSRQEYWTGLPFPSPGDLPDPGIIKPASPMSPASAGRQIFNHLSHVGSPGACYKGTNPSPVGSTLVT